jgi:protein TonB
MDASRTSPGFVSGLSRSSFEVPPEERDGKLAWVNSICILFFLIGVLGSRPGSISTRQPPPIDETVPAIIETVPLQPAPEQKTEEQSIEKTTDAPQVVVVTPDAPSINFSVPTIGNLLVPNAVAAAPPLAPMAAPAPLKSRPTTLENTGGTGERPQPPYPKMAIELGQQGKVTLLITADPEGRIVSLEVSKSSGFPLLDRSAMDHVKRHWLLPKGSGSRIFETSINYRLQLN